MAESPRPPLVSKRRTARQGEILGQRSAVTAFDDADIDAQLEELTDEAARIRSGVVAPEPFTFTLTGHEEQRIDIRIGNTLDELSHPGMVGGSDVPLVLWTWFVGIGHAPEMKEIPRCHVITHPSFAGEVHINSARSAPAQEL